MNRLPKEYKSVLERARSICIGEINESWSDVQHLIHPCAGFMVNEIENRILLIESTGYVNRSIRIDGTS